MPFTFKLVNVPTLVMFGCAFVVTVPATDAVATVPVTLAPETLYAIRAVLALPTVPLIFAAVMFDKLPPSPANLPAITLPVTDKSVKVPIVVIFG